jgi:hypothetical protein
LNLLGFHHRLVRSRGEASAGVAAAQPHGRAVFAGDRRVGDHANLGGVALAFAGQWPGCLIHERTYQRRRTA